MTSAAYGAGAQTKIRASGFTDNASRTACAIVNVLPVPGGPKHTSGAHERSFISSVLVLSFICSNESCSLFCRQRITN